MQTLWQDLRYGARMLMKQPGFTLIAVLTLALGIGANTAIFSLVNTVLLRPLPIRQPERVVEITPLRKGADIGAFPYPFYRDFHDQNQVLEGLAAYSFVPLSLSWNGNNERLWGYLVSGNYFDLLGVRAVQGRMFTQEEDRAPGAHPVAVVSYGSWQRRFGGDPQLVGRTITINNHSFTVVGFAPPGLVLPMLRTGTLSFASVLLAVVGLVLLIACTNLANLLLARVAERRKEIAVRLALGATRFRLVRQLLTESVMLALAGGALGWLLAWWLVELGTAFKPRVDFALTIDLRIDWRVLVFTALVSLITGLLFGLLPAWQATKPDLIPALKDEVGLGGHRRARLRNSLVVAQVALSLVLLAGAGLIVRSLQQVQTVGPGFEVAHTVTASVDLALQGYD